MTKRRRPRSPRPRNAPAETTIRLTSRFRPEITPTGPASAQVQWLADEKREGRMTGSAGAQATAKWLGDYFRALGLKRFARELRAAVRVQRRRTRHRGEDALRDHSGHGNRKCNVWTKISGRSPSARTAKHRARSSSPATDLSRRAKSGGGYDSYAGLDVKDKIVLLLRYVPGGRGSGAARAAQSLRRPALQGDAGARARRERRARCHRAEFTQRREVLPLTNDGTNAGSAILAASISGKAAETLLAPSGKNLKELQTALDSENPHTAGGLSLAEGEREARLRRRAFEENRQRRRRILCRRPRHRRIHPRRRALRSSRRRRDPARCERAGEENKIHPGADDNASGVAWVMELAARARAGTRGASGEIPARHDLRLLDGRGDRDDRLGRFLREAAGAAREDRRLREFRHGRPVARQQADVARRRLVERLAATDRESECRRRFQPRPAGRSRICRPT